MEKKSTKTKLISRTLGFVIVAIQAVASVLLVVSLLNINIVSSTILIIIIAVLAVLLIFNAIKLFIQKNASMSAKAFCAILALLCIAASLFAMRYTDAFNSFLSKVTEQKPETKEYSVVVMNDSNIKDISILKNHSVGFLKTDTKAGNAEQHLQNVIKINSDFYEDLDTLTSALSTTLTDAIVLETSRLEALEEEPDNPLENTQVIYTYEIELEEKDKTISEKEITTEPFIVYISGSDSRVGIKATARSDVNIIAVVNPKEGKILLVSIPRDTYVQLHDTTGLRDKLTHAGIYGINMSKTTIEDFLGIKIDHTIKVGFEAVVKVVDELDGIDITSDQAMKLNATTGGNKKICEYTEGTQHVDGACALRFARERKSYERGDRHRGENQQQVITSIIARLTSSKDYLLKAPSILDAAADLFETSFERDDITAFIRMQLTNPIKWQTESISIDGAGSMQPTYSMGANRPLYVMLASEDSIATAKNKINEYLTVAEEEPVDESE